MLDLVAINQNQCFIRVSLSYINHGFVGLPFGSILRYVYIPYHFLSLTGIFMSIKRYIVWDLGATKCAAAVVKVNRGEYSVQSSTSVLLSSVGSLLELADCLHSQLNVDVQSVAGICVAGAGCYDGRELHLANPYPFRMRFSHVASQQRWPYFEVIHDYTPVVASTFVHKLNDPALMMIRQGEFLTTGRRVAFGVGTGLGLKDAVRNEQGRLWFGDNEMGHIGVTLPPAVSAERASLHHDFMRFLSLHRECKDQPVRFETILSGQGFARVYQFAAGLNAPLSPTETYATLSGDDKWREDTFSLLSWYLGLWVGVIELVFMPQGGIWIGGGVVKKNQALLSAPFLDHFWAGVQAMPAYLEQRSHFPIGVLTQDESIFLGGAFYANQCFPKPSVMPLRDSFIA
jgi:glucokinase